MKTEIILIKIVLLLTILVNLNSCGFYRPVSAKDYPPEPEKRVQKNLQEGRGFTLMGNNNKKSGEFDFATSNEMWRASLDILNFMPLTSADYGGGLIITDWYTDGQNENEDSIKILDKTGMVFFFSTILWTWDSDLKILFFSTEIFII